LFSKAFIQNPKRSNGTGKERSLFYPYYAGFSEEFARTFISSLTLNPEACILDPWNGSGTTTAIAAGLGYRVEGYDLNPVMVIASKARLLSKKDKTRLLPLAKEIMAKAASYYPVETNEDPLLTWLIPTSSNLIRRIERAVQSSIGGATEHRIISNGNDLDSLSSLMAFFYVSLFRALRSLLSPFYASNPTWIKKPRKKAGRIRPGFTRITNVFMSEVLGMIDVISKNQFALAGIDEADSNASIGVASSDFLPTCDESVDLILSSPPYCTRIDYAVATMPELAILGYKPGSSFDRLRRQLIGTPTVPKSVPAPDWDWGPTCNKFLDSVVSHGSKASATYYYKSHVQYFDVIYKSIKELKRTLKPEGACVLVVQDSYYKDIHNDLPKVFIEMAEANSLKLARRTDFHQLRTMAGINPAVRKYRGNFSATESVLCFLKS
jgi:DNA modification methylase